MDTSVQAPMHSPEPKECINTFLLKEYQGIWYFNNRREDAYRYKYSGGLATYPQQHVPIACYSRILHKTFFVYGAAAEHDGSIVNAIGYYNHTSGRFSESRGLLYRQTFDAHYNPTLSIDDQGYLYIFANCHGRGMEGKPDDPLHGKAYILRSVEPGATDQFEVIKVDNFSYSQVWHLGSQGMLHLHTRYNEQGHRHLYASQSADGFCWSEPQPLASAGQGHYMISWSDGHRVVVAMDYHPHAGGQGNRTNLYVIKTDNAGQTWETMGGETLSLPLDSPQNPALVLDGEARGTLIYLKDIDFTEDGGVVVLYLESHSADPGPAGDPRRVRIARWNEGRWTHHDVDGTDHNYDHGSLWTPPGKPWRVIFPTAPGPQPGATGGEMVMYESTDGGRSWQRGRNITPGAERNHSYLRKVWQGHDDMIALWADGHPLEPSLSHLYCCNREGMVTRLP